MVMVDIAPGLIQEYDVHPIFPLLSHLPQVIDPGWHNFWAFPGKTLGSFFKGMLLPMKLTNKYKEGTYNIFIVQCNLGFDVH